MNRILIFEREWNQKHTIEIKDVERLTHIKNVICPRVGDRLKLCLVNFGLAEARVESLSDQSLTLKILERSEGQKANVHLEVGLSRPLTCKKLLEAGASLGVGSFSFFHTKLCQKSYASSKLFKDGGAERAICQGLSISGVYYQMPSWKLHPPGAFPHSKEKQKYFLSLHTQKTFADVRPNFAESIVVAIGPERDWTEQEEQQLLQNGYHPINLGPSILKVEVAACVALGQLQLLSTYSH